VDKIRSLCVSLSSLKNMFDNKLERLFALA
jgi:hypothetical protein